MLHTPTAKFIIQALEASIYVSPEEPGLTADELVAAGEQFGSKDTPKGRILDTLQFFDDATQSDSSGRLRLHGITGLHDIAYFGEKIEPDLRKIAAFDFVYDYLVGLADQHQFANAKATRAEFAGAVAGKAGFGPKDIQVAISVWLAIEFLIEKDGRVSFRSDPRPLGTLSRPSEQLAHNRRVSAGTHQRPDFNRIHVIVEKIISARSAAKAADVAAPARGATPMPSNANKVFVVHGRNHAARDATYAFLRSLDITVIAWNDAIALTKSASSHISEIIKAGMDAAAAIVVLFTGDDEVRVRASFREGNEGDELQPQARPNVYYEAGLAMMRDPQRTILVELGHVRGYSDIAGHHTIRMNNSSDRRNDLVSRLRVAGVDANTHSGDWLKVGDFDGAAR